MIKFGIAGLVVLSILLLMYGASTDEFLMGFFSYTLGFIVAYIGRDISDGTS